MRNPSGYLIITGETTREYDTFTCCHCNSIVVVKKEKDDVGFCTLCFKPICANCNKEGVCVPFERKLEKIEKRALNGY